MIIIRRPDVDDEMQSCLAFGYLESRFSDKIQASIQGLYFRATYKAQKKLPCTKGETHDKISFHLVNTGKGTFSFLLINI